MRRGVKEGLVALAALPVLLTAGIYVGGHLRADGPASLQPAAGALSTPAPQVTVQPATPRPVVTVTPRAQTAAPAATVHPRSPVGPVGPVSAPAPQVTVQPPAPRPVVTVRPPAPRPVVTVQPPAPRPVVTVRPATPAPIATVRPHGPTTAPPPAIPFPPVAQPPSAGPPVAGPVAPTTPPAAPARVLGRGSTGADVRAWQLQMSRRHWRIAVDGIFGPDTERVARRFQQIKGLRIDGLVGRETWDAAWTRPVVL